MHEPQAVSVHRAAVYSLLAPGAGQVHAGARAAGFTLLGLFLAAFAGFCVAFYEISQALATKVLVWMQVIPDQPIPEFSWTPFGIFTFLMAVLWLFSFVEGVRTARAARENAKVPPQESPLWAGVMAWVVPGSGLVYVGRTTRGYLLLGLYACALFALGIEYGDYIGRAVAVMGQGPGSPDEMRAMNESLKTISMANNFGVAHAAAACLTLVSVALTMAWFGEFRPLGRDEERLWAGRVGLLVLGYLAPGSGHCLAGRNTAGAVFALIYGGVLAGAAILFAAGAIPPQDLFIAFWVLFCTRVAAALEAPIRFK